MLSARAYSFRQQSKLAISLSWIGGYVNVVLFVSCGSFASHMTGNSTRLGELLSRGAWFAAGHFAMIIGCFFLGAVTSAIMTEWAQRRGMRSKYLWPVAAEGVLLSLLSVLMTRHLAGHGEWTGATTALAAVAAFALGLQNATITEISGAVIRTTHVTGVVTDLGLEGVRFVNWWIDRARGRRWERAGRLLRVSQRHPSAQRLGLLFGVYCSFVIGAVAGTWMFLHHPNAALPVPVVFIVWIIVMDRWKPIAGVRELDALSDPELSAQGIVKSLLPREMGIYRLTHHRDNVAHRPPDFHQWMHRLPDRWRLVVLAVSPMTRFDGNSVLALRDVIEQMRSRDQELIISGITPRQYKVLVSNGILQAMDAENLCPDLEFAIARGVDMVRAIRAADMEQTAR